MKLLFCFGALLIASSSKAQVRASEQGLVAQVVNGARITVDYARPQARGRDSLFGRRIHWGEVWTPGANWATTLEVDRDVTVEGRPLSKGKYSMWMIPQPGEWTLVLNRVARTYHTQRPPVDSEALRVPIRPVTTPSVEVLTFSFPAVSAQGTRLLMQWSTTSVSIDIGVGAARTNVLAQAEVEKYVGTYRLAWVPGLGPPGETMLRVAFRDGILRGHLDRGLWGGDPDFDLLPQGLGRFRPLLYRQGKPFDAEDGTFEFAVAEGPVQVVRLLGVGRTLATAKREP